MSADRKEILNELIITELKGMSFRRQTEYLTDAVVEARYMNSNALAVAAAKTKAMDSLAAENRVLDTHLTEYQNLEQAVCPPDTTFQTYFEQLEKQIPELQAARRELIALSDSQEQRIKELTLENYELKRRAEACEESKTKSAPPPPTAEEPETEPKDYTSDTSEWTEEDWEKFLPKESETESCTESETKSEESTTPPTAEDTASEDEEWKEEDWEKFYDLSSKELSAEEGEQKESSELPPMSEVLKAVLLLASELPQEVKDAGPLNFQALLDEALKG